MRRPITYSFGLRAKPLVYAVFFSTGSRRNGSNGSAWESRRPGNGCTHREPVGRVVCVARGPRPGFLAESNRDDVYMSSTEIKPLGSMSSDERRAAAGLAAIFGSRMLGLFII